MSNFADLILGADTTGLAKGEAALESIAREAQQTQRTVTGATTGTNAALKGVGVAGAAAAGGFSLAGNGARQMGMQLSQVGQQTMASGNFIQALAIQLPDIGLAFGTVGIAAGLLAGIALPLLANAFSAGTTAAKEFATALDVTKETLSTVTGVISSVSGLEAQYTEAVTAGNGALAQRIVHLIDLRLKEAEYIAMDLPGQIREQQAAYQDLASSAADAGRELAALTQGAQDALSGGDKGQFEIALVLLGEARVEYERLTTQAELAANRTAQMNDELAIAKSALDEAQGSADRLAQEVAFAGSAAETAMRYIGAMQGGLSNAAAAAGGLETSLWGAANAAANAAQNIYAAMQQQVTLRQETAGTGGIMSGFNSSLAQTGQNVTRLAVALNPLQLNFRNVATAAGGGGGGGGAAGAVDALSDSLAGATDELTPAQQAAKEYADTIAGYFTDTIGNVVDWMEDGFKGGMKSLFKIFADGLKQMIAFAIKNKIMVALGMGGSVAGGVAQAATGAAGGGVMSGIGSALGALGSAFTSGLSGAFSGFLSSGFGGALAGAQAAIAGTTTALGGFAAAAGAIALPLLAVAGIFLLFKKKTEVLDAGLRVTIDGLSLMAQQFERVKTTSLLGLISNTRTNFSAAGVVVQNPLQDAYEDVRDNVTDLAAALGIGATAFAGFSHSFQLSLKGLTQEQTQAAIAAEFAKISNGLAAMALGSRAFLKVGETFTDGLTRFSTSLVVVNSAFTTLGFDLLDVSIAGGAAASGIVDVLGGLEAFAQATEAYFQNFYTLAERTAVAQSQFNAALADVGVRSIPQTTEAFRRMVDQLIAVGRTADAAELIGLGPMFLALQQLKDEAAGTVGPIEDLGRSIADIMQERLGLEGRWLMLMGRTSEMRRRELLALDPSNRALQVLIWRLQDQATAADLAATAAQALADKQRSIADERLGLQKQLWELEGNTVALRNAELAALDPTNRAMQLRIWAMQDEAAAADRAASALADAVAMANSFADSLTTDQFMSLFDYERAVGRARNGVGVPGISTNPAIFQAPPTIQQSQTASQENVINLQAVKNELVKMRQENNALLTAINANTKRANDIDRKWDVDGMPPVRTT